MKVTGYDLYHWSEFKALCARLGIAYDLGTTRLIIEIPAIDELVRVTQEYVCEEKVAHADKSDLNDTTTLQNQTWRTKQPRPPQEV